MTGTHKKKQGDTNRDWDVLHNWIESRTHRGTLKNREQINDTTRTQILKACMG